MTGKRLFLGLILAAILLDRGIVYAQTAATPGCVLGADERGNDSTN